jgi:hypothetical protein
MPQIESTSPVRPQCHKPKKLMLAKDGQRILRCVDCGQPDPLASLDTQGWFKGELGFKRYGPS